MTESALKGGHSFFSNKIFFLGKLCIFSNLFENIFFWLSNALNGPFQKISKFCLFSEIYAKIVFYANRKLLFLEN